MLTLPQAQAARLREVRAECGRLDAELRDYFRRQAATLWWQQLTDAAWRGESIPDAVWRSAERDCPEGVARLKVRHRTPSTFLRTPAET